MWDDSLETEVIQHIENKMTSNIYNAKIFMVKRAVTQHNLLEIISFFSD
jgi:hypothetical protein